jgi:hypothetical protein
VAFSRYDGSQVGIWRYLTYKTIRYRPNLSVNGISIVPTRAQQGIKCTSEIIRTRVVLQLQISNNPTTFVVIVGVRSDSNVDEPFLYAYPSTTWSLRSKKF